VDRQRAASVADAPPKVRVELHPRTDSEDEDDEASARPGRRRR
jgi:hypothetical protein